MVIVLEWPLITLGTVPVGFHRGRVAVEQLYGYMARNGKAYGILTTLRGWCFATRRDGGELLMTRMFRHGPEAPDQYRASNVPIMMALYYLSHLASNQPDISETTQGRPGRIDLPWANADTETPAPQRQWVNAVPWVAPFVPPPQPQVPFFQQFTVNPLGPFEPWKKDNQLGGKCWITTLLPDEVKVVVKFWTDDDETLKFNERNNYLRLKPLWGKVIPALVGYDLWQHSNSLGVQYVEVQAC
jgi:hypothetical protein